jgi:hypothetical protein
VINVKVIKAVIFSSTFALSGLATAASIDFTYDFNQGTRCDNRCYHDTTRTKLSDGSRGGGNTQYQSGNNWVGWKASSVQLDFSLSETSQVNQIDFGSITNTSNGTVSFNVYSILDGVSQLETAGQRTRSSGGNNRYSIEGLDFVADSVMIDFSSSNSWLLLDEVSFDGLPAPSSVPLPAAAWLFISAIAGLAGAKRLSRSERTA